MFENVCYLLLMCSAVRKNINHMQILKCSIHELNCNQNNVDLNLDPTTDVCLKAPQYS